MKRKEAKFFLLRCEKSAFFAYFASMQKRRNLKRNENGTKRIQNEKEAKNAIFFASKRNKAKEKGSEKLPSFSLRSEMKQNRSEKMPSFSLRSEMEAKFFRFDAKKVFFSLVFASEAKRK
jgi:hypothetical protein